VAEAMRAMDESASSVIRVGGVDVDFVGVHVTCANVLGDEVGRMEESLFGRVRPAVAPYAEAFRRFLTRMDAAGGAGGPGGPDGTVAADMPIEQEPQRVG
jgi:hypothetical protein